MIINQDYKLVSIDDIKPHPSNPRIGDLATIEESIDVNGFYLTTLNPHLGSGWNLNYYSISYYLFW